VEAEILAIMIVDNDPASGDLGSPFKFGSSSTNDSHVPLNDGDVYENFCDAGRKNSGNPTTSFTSWLGYNVRGIKTPYNRKIIVGSEVLENTGTGTWTEPKSGTACAVGISYQGLYTPPTYPHRAMDGNLAAIYLWSSVLGSTPRGDLVTYINDLWGVTIPST
jgi:hypothetical protein